MAPLLEILAKLEVSWWCYARSDAMLNLSERSWALIRKSRMRMAYIGAESPSDWLLHDIRKGTRPDQTLAAIEACLGHGVIPELSFMVAPPRDPEGETEKTFEFIRLIKRRYPETEVMIYIYTPLPPPPDRTKPAVARCVAKCAIAAGSPWCFRAARTSGPSLIGTRTGVIRARRGSPSVFTREYATSRRCWDAGSRRSWMYVPLRGERPLCEDSLRGAIAMASTIIRGSWISGRGWYG